MRTLRSLFWASLFVTTLGVSAARAQQQDQNQQQQQQQTPDQQQQQAPIPAYRSPLASATGEDESEPQEGTPDNRSLSGAQDLSPLLFSTRSYWQPEIDSFATVDSNPSYSSGGSNWTAGATLSGRLDIHRISGESVMDVSYVGGGSFSTYTGYSTGVTQAFGFSDKISFHRSTLSFFDQLSYLPGSAFGYGGLGGLAGGSLPGSGSTGLGPVFGPGQTILTGEGQSLQNSFVTEFDVDLTPRGKLSFVGGYYLLHNDSSNLLNSGNPNFRGGYNYQLTRKDTIAVFYTFSGYGYSSYSQSIDTHAVQFSYGRTLTQKLSFQIAAGPQYIISQIPISVSGGTTTATSATYLNWSLNTSLRWTDGRNGFGVAYYHGANGGSGVLAGSIGDTISGSLTRKNSRTFTSGISGGFSRNQGAALSSGTLSNQAYDYVYGGASLSRAMGRFLGLTLSYLVQYQTSNSALCAGSVCGMNITTNLVSFGVGWHDRPHVF